MPRDKGKLNYSKDEIQFIKDNWMIMSDQTLSDKTGISAMTIQGIRKRNGLSRFASRIKDNSTKALICELYIMEYPIKEIASIVGKGVYIVYKVIGKCLFGLPKSDDTEFRIFESKV